MFKGTCKKDKNAIDGITSNPTRGKQRNKIKGGEGSKRNKKSRHREYYKIRWHLNISETAINVKELSIDHVPLCVCVKHCKQAAG